jgi:predicted RNA binding protein YcfA (HicA-like mRNA interferase family)
VKLPRGVSGRGAVKALERLGFERVRQAGSHIRLQKGNLKVTVPVHAALSVGTLASILRQAQVAPEEFIREL